MFDRRRDPGVRNEATYLSSECASLESHLSEPLVAVEDKRRRILEQKKEISICKAPQAVSAGRQLQPAQPPYMSVPSPAEEGRSGLLETGSIPERQAHVASPTDLEESGICESICQSFVLHSSFFCKMINLDCQTMVR